MELRKIKFLKSLNPIDFLDVPSKETIEYVAKLFNNKDFKDLVSNLRNKYSFPKNGISLIPFVGLNFHDTPIEKTELMKDSLNLIIDNLRVRMNLPKSFNEQLKLLVFYNTMVDINYFDGFITDKVDYAVTKKKIASKLFDYKCELGAILIPYNLSFNNLMKQIKDIWEKMQSEMDKSLTDNPYELRLHKNTELAMEITRLKEEEKLIFLKISETIFPENHERFGDELYIKKLYYEYKALWENSSNQL